MNYKGYTFIRECAHGGMKYYLVDSFGVKTRTSMDVFYYLLTYQGKKCQLSNAAINVEMPLNHCTPLESASNAEQEILSVQDAAKDLTPQVD